LLQAKGTLLIAYARRSLTTQESNDLSRDYYQLINEPDSSA